MDMIELSLNESPLVREVRTAIREGTQALQPLDREIHERFFEEVVDGTESTRTQFIQGLLAVLESEVARAIPAPDAIQQLLSHWQHLVKLADGFRRDIDATTEAGRILGTRVRGQALFAVVNAAGVEGIRPRDLAEKLGITQQNLAALLEYLEAHDIVVRRREGGNVYVVLGGAGKLLAGRPSLRRVPVPFDETSRCPAALEKPRQLLAS